MQQNIIKEKNIINDLNLKIKEIDKIKKENEIIKNLIQIELNINDEFYDSFKYIKNNNIKLDTVITNEYELEQINNGIRRQKKTNIKKMNFLYRSTRDGGC